MKTQNAPNSFVFNSEIDVSYLNSLYGEDYVYVQEVFDTVLHDYQSLRDNIEMSYSSGNLTALRAAVHKIKPVFGFVGLPAVQDHCQQFEQVCGAAGSPEHLAGDFESLRNKIFHSKQLIEEEKKKLELFNRQSS